MQLEYLSDTLGLEGGIGASGSEGSEILDMYSLIVFLVTTFIVLGAHGGFMVQSKEERKGGKSLNVIGFRALSLYTNILLDICLSPSAGLGTLTRRIFF
jgi:hypothetical protein